jgi:hypothetical protein
MAVVVDGGKDGGGCGRGCGGGLGGEGGVGGEGGRVGGREGGGQGGREGGGRGVLIFDELLISLHFSQTIILTAISPKSKPTTSFATMCYYFHTYYLS